MLSPLFEDRPTTPGALTAIARSSGRHPVRRAVVRGVGFLLLAAVATIALLGALVAPWTAMLLVAPALGAFLAGVALLLGPSGRRDALWMGAAGLLLVPLSHGLLLLGTAGGAVLLLLLALGPLVVGAWPAAAGSASELSGVPDLLAALPVAELLEEWRASERTLRSSPDPTVVAEVRAMLLDELSRRDPAGVAAWLASGGDEPADHVRADRDDTA